MHLIIIIKVLPLFVKIKNTESHIPLKTLFLPPLHNYVSENLQIFFVLKKKKGKKKKNSGNQKEIQSADKNSMMHFKFVICRECLWY